MVYVSIRTSIVLNVPAKISFSCSSSSFEIDWRDFFDLPPFICCELTKLACNCDSLKLDWFSYAMRCVFCERDIPPS